MTHDTTLSVELDALQAVDAARLDAEDLDTIARRLAEALEQPGRPVWMPSSVVARVPPVLLPPLVWAGPGLRAHIVEEAAPSFDGWGAVIASTTGAMLADLRDADLVAVLGCLPPLELRAISHVTEGTPSGTRRLVLRSSSLRPGGFDRPPDAGGGSGALICLHDASLARPRSISIEGIEPELLVTLGQLNASSAAIDAWVAADAGVVVGIPRSTSIEVVETWRGGAAA